MSRYYRSPYWNRVRGKLLYERGGKCEKCSSTKFLQAHHTSYDNWMSELSHMQDLQLLCKICHDTITTKNRRKRRGRGWLSKLF